MSFHTNLLAAENDNTSEVANEENEDESIAYLPPNICTNERKKIQPEQVLLTIKKEKGPERKKTLVGLMWLSQYEKPKPPVPKHEHCLTWWPKNLCFRLKNDEVTIVLNILNSSKRIIFIQYKTIFDDTPKSGASWFVKPKTRMVIAPGLAVQLVIRARPQRYSFIPHAVARLQLATNFQQDLVVGYFSVPLVVVFENFVQSLGLLGQEEAAKGSKTDTRYSRTSKSTNRSPSTATGSASAT